MKPAKNNTLPLREQAEKLFTQLLPIQESKGYFFNNNHTMTLDLLEQLTQTKITYGYMACPCRLANGVYEQDKDIICPCIYRQADVEEYGTCFCGLYVSKELHQNNSSHEAIPERRPPENIIL